MPIYAYRCTACEHEFEVLQKMSDDRLSICPECGKPELAKQVTAAAFRLKGGGWYESDFKTGNQKNLASTDSNSVASAAPSCGAGTCSHQH